MDPKLILWITDGVGWVYDIRFNEIKNGFRNVKLETRGTNLWDLNMKVNNIRPDVIVIPCTASLPYLSDGNLKKSVMISAGYRPLYGNNYADRSIS